MSRCRPNRLVPAALLCVGLALSARPAVAQPAASPAKRPLTMDDLLSWKGVRAPALSNDGRWMAYILAPNEGDAEFVVRVHRSRREGDARRCR